MSTRGVVDIVFLLDASESMRPCLDAVRQHVTDFVKGLGSGQQRVMDWRLDFVAHSCDQDGDLHRMQSMRSGGAELSQALYHGVGTDQLFTTDVAAFQKSLAAVEVGGDEATLVALDTALDFPWRPRNHTHRVIICLTDEPFETGVCLSAQRDALPRLMDKIQHLGVMLYLVAPKSEVFDRLAEVDKSEYQTVEAIGDGLRTVRFQQVLAYIGKSLSVASLHGAADLSVPKALFSQDTWVATSGPMRGR